MAIIQSTGGSLLTGGKVIEGAGTNRVFEGVGAPTNGTSGTFAGSAPVGAFYRNSANGNLYKNTNTQASPTWTLGVFS